MDSQHDTSASAWLLRGGTVVDGSGAPRFAADVRIEGGRIVAVGEICRRNHDSTSKRHRLSAVQNNVVHHLTELTSIGFDRPQLFRQIQFQLRLRSLQCQSGRFADEVLQ